MNEAIEIEQRYLDIVDTLWTNTASVSIRPQIMRLIKQDAVVSKMHNLRAQSLYEAAAARYYAKHGTVGEF